MIRLAIAVPTQQAPSDTSAILFQAAWGLLTAPF